MVVSLVITSIVIAMHFCFIKSVGIANQEYDEIVRRKFFSEDGTKNE